MNTSHSRPHLISLTDKAENSIPLSPLKNLFCELSVVVRPLVLLKFPQCDVIFKTKVALVVVSFILNSSIVPKNNKNGSAIIAWFASRNPL